MKMFRNIARTSRWLARRPINKSAPIILLQSARVKRLQVQLIPFNRQSSTTAKDIQSADQIPPAIFEEICNETLESLCTYFEEIIDQSTKLKGADVTFSDGVLTVALGASYGTYVINRQTPNKQIWLSSPTSGPKRYDLVLQDGGYWIYKHDGVTLHKLLQDELRKIIGSDIDFSNCSHSLF